jgi:hypothetical protein
MANNWNIPKWLEEETRSRDKTCVYCGAEFTPSHVSMKTCASWEHIINDTSIITRENIVLCCVSCNASKGQKKLEEWLKSSFCVEKGITESSVATVVQNALHRGRITCS